MTTARKNISATLFNYYAAAYETTPPLGPSEVIAESLQRSNRVSGIIASLDRAGYTIRSAEKVPLPEATVLSAREMLPWFIEKADDLLTRLKVETPNDIMLYHDAVSVLVAARTMLQLVAGANGNEL